MERLLNVLMGIVLLVIVKVEEVKVGVLENIFYVTGKVRVVRLSDNRRVIINKDLKLNVLTEPRNRFSVINYIEVMRC